jgi:hypothetical protein
MAVEFNTQLLGKTNVVGVSKQPDDKGKVVPVP